MDSDKDPSRKVARAQKPRPKVKSAQVFYDIVVLVEHQQKLVKLWMKWDKAYKRAKTDKQRGRCDSACARIAKELETVEDDILKLCNNMSLGKANTALRMLGY